LEAGSVLPSLNFPQLDFVKPSSGFHPVTWKRVTNNEGEWNWGQGSPTKDKPKQFQGSGFKPKENFVKKGLLSKGTNLREILG
jgi:hypothetical protein